MDAGDSVGVTVLMAVGTGCGWRCCYWPAAATVLVKTEMELLLVRTLAGAMGQVEQAKVAKGSLGRGMQSCYWPQPCHY